MTKRIIPASVFLFAVIILNGCSCQAPSGEKGGESVVTINNYNITRAEFEKEFKDSAYGKIDTPESRKNFLESLIDRKLILQYAQDEGLDKQPAFLKMIEKFWEQSLLKIALDKKTREIEARISASGWDAKRAEESKMMNDWISDMRGKASIKIKEAITKPGAE